MNCKSILIVEDERDIRETVEIILRDEGYEVMTAADGREALEKFPLLPSPPLVLLDMMMPGMTGWEFLKALSEKGDQRDFPVVLMSAVCPVNALVDENGERNIADGMIEKPVDVESLLKVAKHYCEPVASREAPGLNSVPSLDARTSESAGSSALA